MEVGLVRHFEVQGRMPNRWLMMTPDQFRQWLNEYELLGIKEGEAIPDRVKWGKCYTSDLPRAVNTAQKIYKGPIVETAALREIVIYPPTDRNIRLPVMFWLVLGRIAWMVSHPSQLESRIDFKKRLNYITEEIILKAEANVLIVSHAALLIFLRKELLKRGFKGPGFKIPGNGVLYVFEK